LRENIKLLCYNVQLVLSSLSFKRHLLENEFYKEETVNSNVKIKIINIKIEIQGNNCDKSISQNKETVRHMHTHRNNNALRY
jgi:hypothetical protein